MPTPSIIFFLCIFTLAAFISAAAWQRRRVRIAKEHGERTSLGEINSERS